MEVYHPGQQLQTAVLGSLLRKPNAALALRVRDIVGPGFNETGRLNLTTSMVYVARIDNRSDREYIACLDNLLTQTGFITLLENVAPRKIRTEHFSSDNDVISAIDGDWILPERPKLDQRLNELHSKGLGEYWRIFEQSRELFMKVLKTPGVITEESVKRRFSVPRELDSKESVRKNFLIKGVSMTTPELMEFFNRPGMAEIAEEMAKLIKASIRNAKRRDRIATKTGIEAIKSFSELKKSHRERILIEAFNKSSPEIQNKIIDEYIDFRFLRLVVPDFGGKSATLYVEKSRIPSYETSNLNLQIRFFGGNIIAEAIPGITEDGPGYFLDLISAKMNNFLMPLFHWTRVAEGGRTWHYDFVETKKLPTEISVLLGMHAISPEETGDARINPLTGLLTVAYFSPEITIKWPERVGLPGSNIKQNMGPAQVPVLAMMRSGELLRSDFIARLEQHVDNLS